MNNSYSKAGFNCIPVRHFLLTDLQKSLAINGVSVIDFRQCEIKPSYHPIVKEKKRKRIVVTKPLMIVGKIA